MTQRDQARVDRLGQVPPVDRADVRKAARVVVATGLPITPLREQPVMAREVAAMLGLLDEETDGGEVA